jgi:(S)-ureidoglycine aminohydrolase
MHDLGQTRSANRCDHLLLTPDAFVRAPLPCIERGTAIVLVSPANGAAFTQYIAELEAGGTLTSTPSQRFVSILSGSVDLVTDSSFRPLTAGEFAYLPQGLSHTLTAHRATRLAVVEKPYESLDGFVAPGLITGSEAAVASSALMDDVDVQVRMLLPDQPAFDFAFNTMTYQPGASLSRVEIHVMEHGLLMMEGGGIYRLGDAWYSVTAGDFIWMAPFCPQWFGALGKSPAKYLIYKNCNRHPIG